MKRPLLWAAVGTAAALLLFLSLPFNGMLVALAFLLAALAACILLRKREMFRAFVPILLCASLACGYLLLISVRQVWPVQSLAEQEAVISGRIVAEPQAEGGRMAYLVQTDRVELAGAPQSIRLQITDSSAQQADIYDRYTARVRLYVPNDFTRSSRYADGVYLCGTALGDQAVETAESRPLFYQVIRLRRHIRSFFQTHLAADVAASMNGLLLGDRSDMTEEVESNLRNSGISHIMAVSGLHLAVICQGLLFLLKKCRVGRRLSALITMGATVLLMALTGFSASILRAGFTYLIMLTGVLIRARADALNSLGGAVLLILAINPFLIGDLSFQLSVAATLGILLLCPVLYAWLIRRLPDRAACRPLKAGALVLAQTLAATLFTLPITFLRFDRISLVSPLTNLAVSAAASAALLCGVLAVALFSLPLLHFVGYPFLLAAGLLIRYINAAADFFGNLPFATAPTLYVHIQIWLAAVLTLTALALLLPGRRRRLLRMTATASAFLLAISCCAYTLFQHGVTSVSLLDTEEGLSILLTRGSRSALIGAGGSRGDYYTIRSALQARGGGKADLLLLPDTGQTYTGGLKQLLREQSFACLASPSRTLAASLRADGEADGYTLLESNQELHMWGDVVLRPVSAGENAGIYLEVGQTAFLALPAGADTDQLPAGCRNPQVLLTGDQPPEGLSAQLGLVSADPEGAPAAAAALALQGIPAYATGGEGGLTVQTRGEGDITVRREGV